MSGTDDVRDVLVVGDTLSSPDLRRALPAMVPDPVIYLEQGDRRTVFVLDRVASETFERAGLRMLRKSTDRGFYHEHELGHGIGLQVHEPPLVGPGGTAELLENEVLAIEPALYRFGFGGCRLEDMVLVTADGGEVLTDYGYSLEP